MEPITETTAASAPVIPEPVVETASTSVIPEPVVETAAPKNAHVSAGDVVMVVENAKRKDGKVAPGALGRLMCVEKDDMPYFVCPLDAAAGSYYYHEDLRKATEEETAAAVVATGPLKPFTSPPDGGDDDDAMPNSDEDGSMGSDGDGSY